jgi:hypothetical protein
LDTRLTSALKSFRERYPGHESSWQRLQGWLLDHAPEERRAVRALVSVPRLDLHAQIARLPGRIDPFSFRRLTDTLTSQDGLSAELAEQALLVWLAVMGIEAPDTSALRGPVDKGLVGAHLDAVRCLHLALVQSDLRSIAQLRVESLTARPLADLVVSVWLAGVEVGSPLRSSTWSAQLGRLQGRQVALLENIDVRVSLQGLHEIQAPVHARWWIEVKSKDDVLLRTWHDVEAHPARSWLYGLLPLPALAAFVLPEDPIVAEIVGEAATRIDDADPRSAPIKALDALQAVLVDLAIAEERTATGRVTCPRAVVARGSGTTIDIQLLLAACLEHGGMPPLLAWTSTGPAIGLWNGGDRPALTETDDSEILARLEDSGLLTMVAVGPHVLRLREEVAGGGSFAALDLTAARRAGVLSLSGGALDDGSVLAIGGTPAGELRQRLLDRAALGSVRSGMLLPGAWSTQLAKRPTAEVTTAPRLQAWKRRLLDLTLNNPLLNLRQRVTSLPLLACDLPALEDALAAGRILALVPRPAAAHPGAPRPDVTPDMMRGAMASGSLLVDLPDKRVATQAKNALRALRAAIDDGGVHTLFLTLGALEWLEAGRADGPRIAPLVLVPVLLRRARAGHYELKKADAETEFNAALNSVSASAFLSS